MMPTTIRSSLAVAPSRGVPAPALQRLQLCTLSLLLMASLATSWPNRIRSGFVCDDLHVTHAGSNVEMARGNVSLVLLKDGREVQCYEPGQLYEVELRSNYKEIMGVLWRLDPVIGEFPLGAEPRNTKFSSICGQQTVSHYCENQAADSRCTVGHNGRSLKVGYRAPSNNPYAVFRYTVVFSVREYVENEKKYFEQCLTNEVTKTTATTEFTRTTTTTTEPESRCSTEATDSSGNHLRPEDDNLTVLKYEDNPTIEKNSEEECNTFEPKEGAIAATGHCGIKRSKSNESRYYTDPETCITYNCVIRGGSKLYARKVTCEPRCDKNGRPQICRVKKTVQRKRDFMCTPTGRFEAQGYGTIYPELFIENQSQCECYAVDKVDMLCPTVPPATSGQRTTTTAIPSIPSHISNLP